MGDRVKYRPHPERRRGAPAAASAPTGGTARPVPGYFSWRLNGFAQRLGMTPIYWDVDDQCYPTQQYGHGARMGNHMVTRVKGPPAKGPLCSAMTI